MLPAAGAAAELLAGFALWTRLQELPAEVRDGSGSPAHSPLLELSPAAPGSSHRGVATRLLAMQRLTQRYAGQGALKASILFGTCPLRNQKL